MIDTLTAVVTLLADEPRNTGPEFGKATPLGLLVTVALLVGTFALVWSMNRHLRKLPESFDREHPEPDQAADEGTAEGDENAVNSTPDDQGQSREPGGG
ncbi:hypothetical protein A5731_17005 [Mycolicibacterium conceptionense]|jgi:hypothetical protein|uniref:Transmembrane protein n=3 Tax=Mycolicibacterium TaxID=1866885 RepID=A0A0J8TXQ0_9MYCO|nr:MULTISPECIES: hypothetical protein [Mycolicibacterium]KLI04376.1 hypothetical protein AA982_30425 [Mycolicibacterium senegalense]KLO53993.1 hypothetical protein ABW05_23490 [Mycolicibacterium senegalense]KMV14166.1 hypothetical protein ACT17_31475 [Mycolicibacterium conceptionense]MCW1824968.1 hypothetical protein [Mycolicibacterium senegalense]OBB13665.1 hypothetical protein A5718_02790 [Mycolicibacterium conceptionense]